MNVENIRNFALQLGPEVTEELFTEQWICWRTGGKWFLLMQLDAPEKRVAVKLPPSQGAELREQYDAVRPAFHMNKQHWNDLYIEQLPDLLVQQLIQTSYNIVKSKVKKPKNRE